METASINDGHLDYMVVNPWEKTYQTNEGSVTETIYPFCNASKIYGAHNTAELVSSQSAYGFVQNDLFVLTDADAIQDKPYMTGRYLVALGDSSKAASEAGKKDVFSYQNYGGKKYYKLAFVPAIHIGDSLIIASTNDTINVTSNNFDDVKPCDFAFHYTDASRTAFTIETAYGFADETGKYNRGYIKYHNGVPVVTAKSSDAEVFELEAVSMIPTANEEEVAVEGISIVAVAVDGEEAVKAIVK